MAKERRVEFKVSFVLPPDAKVIDAKDYIEDAVLSWSGSLRPPGADPENPDGDPMFDLDKNTVRVTRVVATRRRKE